MKPQLVCRFGFASKEPYLARYGRKGVKKMRIHRLLALLFFFCLSFPPFRMGIADPLDQWHLRSPLPTANLLCGVSFCNGTIVVVGFDRTILTSPDDGVTWMTRTSGTNDLYAVAYGNGTFVALGVDTTTSPTTGVILTSPDGVTWTARNSGTNAQLYGVAYGDETFVLVGERGTILQSDPIIPEGGGDTGGGASQGTGGGGGGGGCFISTAAFGSPRAK